MKYAKYHGLGNDYLVIRPNDVDGDLESEQIQLICHRNYGLGSDGILLGPLPSNTCDFRLRILNPDGSEAEKSGNGLRIFARFLYDQGLVYENRFTVETLGGTVICCVRDGDPCLPRCHGTGDVHVGRKIDLTSLAMWISIAIKDHIIEV